MEDINKIIKYLSLTASSKREDTIENLIHYTLYSINSNVSKDEIKILINSEFLIELPDEDLDNAIETLLQNNKLFIQDGKFCIDERIKKQIYKNTLEFDENNKNRFERFCKFIDSLLNENIDNKAKKHMAELYSNYLYECFYEYGNEVIIQFLPYRKEEIEELNKVIEGSILKKTLDKIPSKKLKETFYKITEEFPKQITIEDLEFIESIAEKAESFFSLGLSKDAYDTITQLEIIDWVLFLDTNILYCILGLDYQPDCESCIKLLDLCKKSEFNIKLQYLPKTLVELRKKKYYFEELIQNVNFTKSQIRALLNSGQLDEYSRCYFKRKLENPNLPHPSDIIGYAQKILASNSISIYQSKFENLEENEKYLTDQNAKYSVYIRKINEIRKKNRQLQIERSPDKIDHDVFLREAILDMREVETVTLNAVKYFGVTLDKTLLKYDHYVNSLKTKNVLVPTFFSPAFLLNKLIKLSPISTDNHKKAFMSAISSQAFEKEKNKSITAQKTVKYFHSLGIEDEKLIYQCITDDIFLEEFHKKEGTVEIQQFVQSEIDTYIKKIEYEKDKLQKDLEDKELSIKDKVVVEAETEIKLKEKKELIRQLESQIRIFENELSKVKLAEIEKTKKTEVAIELEETEIETYDEKIIKVNWQKIKQNLLNIIKSKSNFAIFIDVTLFLIIVFSGILSDTKIVKYILVASLGLSLFSGLSPKIKDSRLYSYLCYIILLIFAFFIIVNFSEIISYWWLLLSNANNSPH